MNTEIWKPILGFEHTHEVSNLGRVRSIPHFDATNHYVKGKILSQELVWTGYKRVQLRAGSNTKKFYVHRLVATTFLQNPNNLPYVNHKDEDKANNIASNLEWCNQSYNLKYGNRVRKVLDKCKLKGASNAEKAVVQELDGVVLSIFPSIHEASRQTGICTKLISRVCNNQRTQTYGYKFKFL